MAELTKEEEAEFTPFNAAAFDLVRVEAMARGEVPPAWLCTSNEAKAETRRKLCEKLRRDETFPFYFGDEYIEQQVNRVGSLLPLVERWKQAELYFKTEREGGNPGAYFVR